MDEPTIENAVELRRWDGPTEILGTVIHDHVDYFAYGHVTNETLFSRGERLYEFWVMPPDNGWSTEPFHVRESNIRWSDEIW